MSIKASPRARSMELGERTDSDRAAKVPLGPASRAAPRLPLPWNERYGDEPSAAFFGLRADEAPGFWVGGRCGFCRPWLAFDAVKNVGVSRVMFVAEQSGFTTTD
jgi:hypothetical protein